MLTAIIGFMPSAGGGAIGSIDYSPETRQAMAKESRKWTCPICRKCNEELLPLDADDALSTSVSELSTSMAAVVDEQARFPAAQIVIEKIERLDESGAAASPLAEQSGLRRRGAAAGDPTEEDSTAQGKAKKAAPVRIESNNNNNAPPEPVALPEALAPAPRVVPAPVSGGSPIDILIAAVFFALLFLVLNKWVVTR